jgi:hypothetical protein
MRMTKTFSLDVKTIIKLKSCRNQSATVEKAVLKYLNEKDEFDLGDVPVRQLMAALHARDVCPVLNAALINQLTTS